MINNSNINWENKYPFKIFSISNFLNENDYNKINLNFPNFEDINKDNFFKFEDNKFGITSGSPEYQKIILQNETLKNFHDFVNGDQFKKIFFFNLFKHILFSRKYDLKHFFNVLNHTKSIFIMHCFRYYRIFISPFTQQLIGFQRNFRYSDKFTIYF